MTVHLIDTSPDRRRHPAWLGSPASSFPAIRTTSLFGEADYALYRDFLAQHCRVADVEVWAWCLMPNHVHLILMPSDGLRRALA